MARNGFEFGRVSGSVSEIMELYEDEWEEVEDFEPRGRVHRTTDDDSW